MTGASPNASQIEAWNGDGGHLWVAQADERDRFLAPVARELLTAASPEPGMRVLDVGCGCGATTLSAAAQLGSTGTVTGVDVSAPMLDVARGRARANGTDNVSFVLADAQDHAFEADSVDLMISRFGTMFFSDPGAAFANLATSLCTGGRVCFATWQPLSRNEWLSVPIELFRRRAEPTPSVEVTGMFSQADPDRVDAMLQQAGYRSIDLRPVDVAFTVGHTVDEALDYLTSSGPVRALAREQRAT